MPLGYQDLKEDLRLKLYRGIDIVHRNNNEHGAGKATKHSALGGHIRGASDIQRRPSFAKADRVRFGLHPVAVLGRHTCQRAREAPR